MLLGPCLPCTGLFKRKNSWGTGFSRPAQYVAFSPHGSLLWTFAGWQGSGKLSQRSEAAEATYIKFELYKVLVQQGKTHSHQRTKLLWKWAWNGSSWFWFSWIPTGYLGEVSCLWFRYWLIWNLFLPLQFILLCNAFCNYPKIRLNDEDKTIKQQWMLSQCWMPQCLGTISVFRHNKAV